MILKPYPILTNHLFFLCFTFSRPAQWRAAMNRGYPRTDSLSPPFISNGTQASSTVCLPDVLISTLAFCTSGMSFGITVLKSVILHV